jgi:hypothetical protein
MVKCLNKYGISFETVKPSTEIQRGMPLWCHPGKDRWKQQENNSKRARCMRSKHAVLTVGDGLDLAKRLDNPLYAGQASCMCDECDDDRMTRRCEKPHACATAAASRIEQILPRWIPSPGDTMSQGPVAEQDQDDDAGHFLPPESITELAQGLRIMMLRDGKPQECPNPLIRRWAAVTPAPEAVTVCIAGSVHVPPRKRASTAAGIFLKAEDSGNKGRCGPKSEVQSQFVGELFATLEAIRNTVVGILCGYDSRQLSKIYTVQPIQLL